MLTVPPSDREPQLPSSGSAALPSPGSVVGASGASVTVVAPATAAQTLPGLAGAALNGRRIGLICLDRQAPAAALFIEAAEGLGAQVSVLHAADVADAGSGQQDKLVRMLARLYDLIECQDLPTPAVRRIAELINVPVLVNLGASALPLTDALPVERDDIQAWQQGLARVRQALLSAL